MSTDFQEAIDEVAEIIVLADSDGNGHPRAVVFEHDVHKLIARAQLEAFNEGVEEAVRLVESVHPGSQLAEAIRTLKKEPKP